MPVTVSLLELVKVSGTRELWPAALRGFEEKLQADPTEPAHWGAAADWCEEDGVAEPDLGEAYRWVFKRLPLGLTVGRGKESWERNEWKFESGGNGSMPDSVRGALGYGARSETIAGLMGLLAAAFAKLREEMF